MAVWVNMLTFPLLLIMTIAAADKSRGEILSVAEHLVAQWRMHSFKK